MAYQFTVPAETYPKTIYHITPTSLALFLAYAEDAGNWSGTPLVGGNVGGSKADRGNLTQLKMEGLITTFTDEGNTWLKFTPRGVDMALEHGIDLRDLYAYDRTFGKVAA